MIHVQMPPIKPSKPKAANGNKLCINVSTPINGAVNNHIRAHTIQENIQIFRFNVGTNSLVQATKIVCEQVVAAFDINAKAIANVT